MKTFKDERGCTNYDITGCNLLELVKAAYDLSAPQGMGFLHYKQGKMTDEQAQEILDKDDGGKVAIHMDYVGGRSIKLRVLRKGDMIYIEERSEENKWYDHTNAQFDELLRRAFQDCEVF